MDFLISDALVSLCGRTESSGEAFSKTQLATRQIYISMTSNKLSVPSRDAWRSNLVKIASSPSEICTLIENLRAASASMRVGMAG